MPSTARFATPRETRALYLSTRRAASRHTPRHATRRHRRASISQARVVCGAGQERRQESAVQTPAPPATRRRTDAVIATCVRPERRTWPPPRGRRFDGGSASVEPPPSNVPMRLHHAHASSLSLLPPRLPPGEIYLTEWKPFGVPRGGAKSPHASLGERRSARRPSDGYSRSGEEGRPPNPPAAARRVVRCVRRAAPRGGRPTVTLAVVKKEGLRTLPRRRAASFVALGERLRTVALVPLTVFKATTPCYHAT